MATLFAASAPSALDVDDAAPACTPARQEGYVQRRVAKRDLRAAEYRLLALAARALADTSPLPHVREKHEVAAARWTALALLDEQPTRLPAHLAVTAAE